MCVSARAFTKAPIIMSFFLSTRPPSNGTTPLRSNSKTSMDNGKVLVAENNNSLARSNSNDGGASAGNGSGSLAQDRNRRTGVSNSYTVPALTVETLSSETDTDAHSMNAEPNEVDNNRLTVLSDISED